MSTDDNSDQEPEEPIKPAEEPEEPIIVIEKLKPKQNLTGPTFLSKKPEVKKSKNTLNRSEQKEVGNWEKYEKGFGSKMLLKMGWEKGKVSCDHCMILFEFEFKKIIIGRD